MTADEIARRCANAKARRGGWQACCPAHEDTTPSLSITDGDKGILLKCFAGCEPEAIMQALGLTMHELFYEEQAPTTTTAAQHVVATYPYYNPEGHLLYEVIRYNPKSFRQRRPDPTNPGGWLYKMDGIEYVPYHLPELQEALAKEQTIYIVEGEKDVHTLERLGLCATTFPGGSNGRWEDGYPEYFRDARVIILPDNDLAGEKYATKIKEGLKKTANAIAVVHLPDLPPKGDVSDWVAQGGTLQGLESLSVPQPGLSAVRLRRDETAMPPLGKKAVLPEHIGEHAAPWLDAYIHYSIQWSPRAARSFHQGVGLWILSTIAARRICVELGSPIYPVLFLALAARSTLFAKTTTAKLGRDAIVSAGCGHLLAADRATPQALLRAMSGIVPSNYGHMTPDEQEQVRLRLAFSGQKGWFFEEWGGLLAQMTRKDSPMAEFHSLLRVLDDGYDTYASETIQRGLEEVHAPYLALLANATPHDLGRYMAPGGNWWHDGFWPRFAFLIPGRDELPSLDMRPYGRGRFPSKLVVTLNDWYRRLGVPIVTMAEKMDAKGKPTGEYRADVAHPPCRPLPLAHGVYDAYTNYNQALLTMIVQGDVSDDLSASYGRLHDKALRIAMLLSSVANTPQIELSHWAYAQRVVESWRQNLHTVVVITGESAPPSPLEQREEKIEAFLARVGASTARNVCRELHMSSTEFAQLISPMEKGGRVFSYTEGRKTLYAIPEEYIEESIFDKNLR